MDRHRLLKGAFTALVLCALSLTCEAGELIVHTLSRHSANNHDTAVVRGYNNQNFGLGWRTDDSLIFGVYRNSYYRTTAYVGREFMLNQHVGAFAVLATGYGRPISPVGGLILKVPLTERTALEVVGFPQIGKLDGVAHLSVSYRF